MPLSYAPAHDTPHDLPNEAWLTLIAAETQLSAGWRFVGERAAQADLAMADRLLGLRPGQAASITTNTTKIWRPAVADWLRLASAVAWLDRRGRAAPDGVASSCGPRTQEIHLPNVRGGRERASFGTPGTTRDQSSAHGTRRPRSADDTRLRRPRNWSSSRVHARMRLVVTETSFYCWVLPTNALRIHAGSGAFEVDLADRVQAPIGSFVFVADGNALSPCRMRDDIGESLYLNDALRYGDARHLIDAREALDEHRGQGCFYVLRKSLARARRRLTPYRVPGRRLARRPFLALLPRMRFHVKRVPARHAIL